MSMGTPSEVEISAIVPVGSRHADMAALYAEYESGLRALGMPFECIFVLDGPRPEAAAALLRLAGAAPHVTVIGLTRPFGESTAIMAGFERARGRIILTLPAHHQIEGTEIGKLVRGLQSADMVIAHRFPRAGSKLEALRRGLFHGIIGWITGMRFHDLGCSARAMKRRVLEEVHLYGDQHRFLPLLADRQGFRVLEVDVRQSRLDRFAGTYSPRVYARSALDIFTVFFLVRFTKKPLRFFGMIGASTFAVGAALVAWLVIERLFFGEPLADRPALLLASLLAVLGLQVFAIGLLGELIIFTHARDVKDYQIDEIVHFPQAGQPPAVGSSRRELLTG